MFNYKKQLIILKKVFTIFIIAFSIISYQVDDLSQNEESILTSKGIFKKLSLNDLKRDKQTYKTLKHFNHFNNAEDIQYRNIIQTNHRFIFNTNEFK